jgi:hypothetical protein
MGTPPYQPPGPPYQEGQPYQQGQPYQYPQGYRWMPQDHPQAMTVLVLGILSMTVCQLLGPVAWTMGHSALQDIDANPSAYANRGTVLAGYICGIIATCLLALFVVGIAAAIILGASSSS